MRTKISSIHFKAADSLKEFAEEEARRLEKFSDEILNCEIEFSYTKTEKDVHMHVNVNGSVLDATGTSDDFKRSVVAAVDKIEQQLKKLKGKQQTRRAAGAPDAAAAEATDEE
ncbi:MAG TPA: ribosome-associated translation inhibitor RaiA [bacterium]|jgi:putative sigma-54 modulation protein